MPINSAFIANPMLQRKPETAADWVRWANEMSKHVSDIVAVALAQAAADTAQTAANTAQAQANLSGVIGLGQPFVWNSTAAGVMPAGDPTRDLIARFYDKAGLEIATRTLKGSLTSATGNIAVTAVSVTGQATTYALTDDATKAVRADVKHTASNKIATLSWAAVDESVAGGTPATGGGK